MLLLLIFSFLLYFFIYKVWIFYNKIKYLGRRQKKELVQDKCVYIATKYTFVNLDSETVDIDMTRPKI
jgi:hypothetical protein